MSVQLIFATGNPGKIREARELLGENFGLTSMKEAGLTADIPEPWLSLEENAREKSRAVYRLTRMECFAEDTGLEAEALDGEPGVHSARFAGLPGNAEDNIRLLLDRLQGKSNRSARFRTVISLIWKGREYLFPGTCPGMITTGKRGNAGFGYDPVFQPEGSEKTFAEMTPEEKNRISHRAMAFLKLKKFLLSWPD